MSTSSDTPAGWFVPGEIPAPVLDRDRPGAELAPVADPDGAEPARMQVVDGETRWKMIVEARKIPAAERDVIRPILPNNDALAERGFVDGLGADSPDDDPTHPVGSVVYYELFATQDEIGAMRAASNAISVTVAPLVQAH